MDTNSANSNQSIQIPPDMRTYITNLLNDAGISNLDEELREAMIKEVYERLDQYITSVIVEHMQPEHVDEFIRMNEEKKPQEEVQKFLLEKIPNAQEVMTKAFTDFRELYLGKVAVASQTPPSVDQEANKN